MTLLASANRGGPQEIPSTDVVVNAAPMPDAPPGTNAIVPDTLDAIAKG
jgi:hypothetical protein